MSNELTLKAISTYNGNLHNGLTTALEAVVSMVLEEAAKVAEASFGEGYHIAAAICALKEGK